MKSKCTLPRLVWYDLKVGARQNRYRFLFALLMLVFVSELSILSMRQNMTQVNFWNYCYQAFLGIIEYTKDRTSQFTLPILVMLFQLILLFLVGSYPKQGMCGYGKAVFFESGSKRIWWMSKYIWMVCNILFYYAAFFLVLIVCTALEQSEGAIFSLQASEIFAMTGASAAKFLQNLLLLPLLTSFTMGAIQLLLSVFVKPVWGYAACIVILIVSAYLTSPYLIGNYFMMARNADMAGGPIHLQSGICINVLLCFVVWAAGAVKIKHYDLLSRS